MCTFQLEWIFLASSCTSHNIYVYEYMYFTFLHSALNPWCESIPLLAHINISWRWKSQMIEKWFLVTIFCAVPSSLALTLSLPLPVIICNAYIYVCTQWAYTQREQERETTAIKHCICETKHCMYSIRIINAAPKLYTHRERKQRKFQKIRTNKRTSDGRNGQNGRESESIESIFAQVRECVCV